MSHVQVNYDASCNRGDPLKPSWHARLLWVHAVRYLLLQLGSLLLVAVVLVGGLDVIAYGQGGRAKDVIFLVDVSPSVCSADQVGKVPGCTVLGADPRGFRSKLVQKAGAVLLERCPSCRLGLITFGGKAEVRISLTSSWPSSPINLPVVFNTDFRPPFQLAMEEFRRHRTWEEGREPVIILISDGNPTVPPLGDAEDIRATSNIVRDLLPKGKRITFYALALEQAPQRWTVWMDAFSDMLPPSHVIYVKDVESAIRSLFSAWVFPVKTEGLSPLSFKLLSPRVQFVERWEAQVCAFPPLSAGRVISGTLVLESAKGLTSARVPLFSSSEDRNCFAVTSLPPTLDQGEYRVLLSEAYYERDGKTKKVVDQNLGHVRLLNRVEVSLDAPRKVSAGEPVELRIEVHNAAILPQPLTPLALDIRVDSATVTPARVESEVNVPKEGNSTFIVTLDGDLFLKPATVNIMACLRHSQTADGLPIPPEWRCSQQVMLTVVPPPTPRPTEIPRWLQVLLWAIGLSFLVGLIAFLGWRAYKPELLWLQYRVTRDPERALGALISYLTHEEARVRERGAHLLQDMVETRQGRRGYLFHRLFSLGRSSVTRRQILALGISRYWGENPPLFLKEALLFAREMPIDFFLFVALSPFGMNGDRQKDMSWRRYERILSQAQSWVPTTGRRRDLQFVRLVRRIGVNNLLRGEGLSVDKVGILGSLEDIAQHKPHPASVLAAIYYEMGEGLKADVPAQDRPRVEELLQDTLDVLKHMYDTQPLDEENRMYWESALRFVSFLQECWLTGRVPKYSPEAFKPFAPWADKVIEILRLAQKYKGKQRIPVEVKRRLVHEMEAIDPPFRSLVAHIVSVWGVI